MAEENCGQYILSSVRVFLKEHMTTFRIIWARVDRTTDFDPDEYVHRVHARIEELNGSRPTLEDMCGELGIKETVQKCRCLRHQAILEIATHWISVLCFHLILFAKEEHGVVCIRHLYYVSRSRSKLGKVSPLMRVIGKQRSVGDNQTGCKGSGFGRRYRSVALWSCGWATSYSKVATER
jgi:hypothetical protein